MVFEVIVSPGVRSLLDRIVNTVAFVLVLLDNVGLNGVGLPCVVFWACAEISPQRR